MKKRLKDDTMDPYDYPDDWDFSKAVVIRVLSLVGIAVAVSGGTVWIACLLADWLIK